MTARSHDLPDRPPISTIPFGGLAYVHDAWTASDPNDTESVTLAAAMNDPMDLGECNHSMRADGVCRCCGAR